MKRFDVLEKDLLKGVNLIQASAGTGKTYSIALLFLRLILELGLSAIQILAVTFTNAATEEMKDRIRRFLYDAQAFLEDKDVENNDIVKIIEMSRQKHDSNVLICRIEEALLVFDEAAIFTIHGFCTRILHENAFETRVMFQTELTPDDKELVLETVEDFYREKLYSIPVELGDYLKLKKITIKDLAVLGRTRINSPLIRLEPAGVKVDMSEITKAMAGVVDLYNKTRTVWIDFQDKIWDILKNSKAISKGKYKETQIQNLAKYFVNTRFSFNLPDRFFYYTRLGIEEHATGKADPPKHEFFELCDRLKQEIDRIEPLMDRVILGLKLDLFHTVARKLQLKKLQSNVRSYDDLLLAVYRTLTSDKESRDTLVKALQNRYKAVLIDEFQDTDPIQYEIFKILFGEGSTLLFFIGDPKQAIYSFRGADVFAYMKAAGNISLENRYTMKTSYRAEPRLVEAVNRLFSIRANPFLFEEIDMSLVKAAEKNEQWVLTEGGNRKPPLIIWFGEDKDSSKSQPMMSGEKAGRILVEAVALEMLRLLDPENQIRIGENLVKPGDMAVLVRTHKEAEQVQKTLRHYGIPAVIFRSDNVFNSREAQEMEALLHAIVTPADGRAIRAALLTGILGGNIRELDTLAGDDIDWESWLERFDGFHQDWTQKGFLQMFRRLMVDNDVREHLLGYPDGERRLTNVLHLTELLHSAAVETDQTMSGVLTFLSERIHGKDSKIEEYELRLESDANAVQIVTVHRSKGLEYPVVFCPFLWSHSELRDTDRVVIHDVKKNAVLHLSPEDDALNRAKKEALAENVRMMYVAVTRAKSRCTIGWAKIKKAGNSAPAYLFHGKEGDSNSYDAKTIAELHADLLELADYQTIALMELPEPSAGYIRVEYGLQPELFPARTLSKRVPPGWRIYSYSSLTALGGPEETELPDRDAVVEESKSDAAEFPAESGSIFLFPRGARAGSALHEIMEQIDFSQTDFGFIVEQTLKKYGLSGKSDDGHEWTPVVSHMINNVLSTTLETGKECFSLAGIPAEKRLAELEFCFSLTPKGNIMANQLPDDGDGGPVANQAEGYIKGFIDLVFQHGERFYIVDWKSNHLGNAPEDYHEERIRQAMLTHNYNLQYRIYTAALVRYLRVRLNSFDYERHFGGVFYIFLRGVRPRMGSRYGIFWDRPSKKEMDDFMARLIGKIL